MAVAFPQKGTEGNQRSCAAHVEKNQSRAVAILSAHGFSSAVLVKSKCSEFGVLEVFRMPIKTMPGYVEYASIRAANAFLWCAGKRGQLKFPEGTLEVMPTEVEKRKSERLAPQSGSRDSLQKAKRKAKRDDDLNVAKACIRKFSMEEPLHNQLPANLAMIEAWDAFAALCPTRLDAFVKTHDLDSECAQHLRQLSPTVQTQLVSLFKARNHQITMNYVKLRIDAVQDSAFNDITLQGGAQVGVVERKEEWIKVISAEGAGWMRKKYLADTSSKESRSRAVMNFVDKLVQIRTPQAAQEYDAKNTDEPNAECKAKSFEPVAGNSRDGKGEDKITDKDGHILRNEPAALNKTAGSGGLQVHPAGAQKQGHRGAPASILRVGATVRDGMAHTSSDKKVEGNHDTQLCAGNVVVGKTADIDGSRVRSSAATNSRNETLIPGKPKPRSPAEDPPAYLLREKARCSHNQKAERNKNKHVFNDECIASKELTSSGLQGLSDAEGKHRALKHSAGSHRPTSPTAIRGVTTLDEPHKLREAKGNKCTRVHVETLAASKRADSNASQTRPAVDVSKKVETSHEHRKRPSSTAPLGASALAATGDSSRSEGNKERKICDDTVGNIGVTSRIETQRQGYDGEAPPIPAAGASILEEKHEDRQPKENEKNQMCVGKSVVSNAAGSSFPETRPNESDGDVSKRVGCHNSGNHGSPPTAARDDVKREERGDGKTVEDNNAGQMSSDRKSTVVANDVLDMQTQGSQKHEDETANGCEDQQLCAKVVVNKSVDSSGSPTRSTVDVRNRGETAQKHPNASSAATTVGASVPDLMGDDKIVEISGYIQKCGDEDTVSTEAESTVVQANSNPDVSNRVRAQDQGKHRPASPTMACDVSLKGEQHQDRKVRGNQEEHVCSDKVCTSTKTADSATSQEHPNVCDGTDCKGELSLLTSAKILSASIVCEKRDDRKPQRSMVEDSIGNQVEAQSTAVDPNDLRSHSSSVVGTETGTRCQGHAEPVSPTVTGGGDICDVKHQGRKIEGSKDERLIAGTVGAANNAVDVTPLQAQQTADVDKSMAHQRHSNKLPSPISPVDAREATQRESAMSSQIDSPKISIAVNDESSLGEAALPAPKRFKGLNDVVAKPGGSADMVIDDQQSWAHVTRTASISGTDKDKVEASHPGLGSTQRNVLAINNMPEKIGDSAGTYLKKKFSPILATGPGYSVDQGPPIIRAWVEKDGSCYLELQNRTLAAFAVEVLQNFRLHGNTLEVKFVGIGNN